MTPPATDIMDITELIRLAKREKRRHDRALIEIFNHLRTIDPEIADRAINSFGGKVKAASWLANPVRDLGPLGSMIPLQALAQGQRRFLIVAIQLAPHGIFD